MVLTIISTMNKRRLQISEIEYFNPIPVDLVINIFSRLRLKCVARCRCVSKQWSAIIQRPNYNQLFPIKSPAAPRLLFVFTSAYDLFITSSHQPQNPDQNSSLVATLRFKTLSKHLYRLSRPVHGLVCRQHIGKKKLYQLL